MVSGANGLIDFRDSLAAEKGLAVGVGWWSLGTRVDTSGNASSFGGGAKGLFDGRGGFGGFIGLAESWMPDGRGVSVVVSAPPPKGFPGVASPSPPNGLPGVASPPPPNGLPGVAGVWSLGCRTEFEGVISSFSAGVEPKGLPDWYPLLATAADMVRRRAGGEAKGFIDWLLGLSFARKGWSDFGRSYAVAVYKWEEGGGNECIQYLLPHFLRRRRWAHTIGRHMHPLGFETVYYMVAMTKRVSPNPNTTHNLQTYPHRVLLFRKMCVS